MVTIVSVFLYQDFKASLTACRVSEPRCWDRWPPFAAELELPPFLYFVVDVLNRLSFVLSQWDIGAILETQLPAAAYLSALFFWSCRNMVRKVCDDVGMHSYTAWTKLWIRRSVVCVCLLSRCCAILVLWSTAADAGTPSGHEYSRRKTPSLFSFSHLFFSFLSFVFFFFTFLLRCPLCLLCRLNQVNLLRECAPVTLCTIFVLPLTALKVRHVDFKFLLKADDDTFVCVQRLADFLHDQPEESKDKIYAGVPTACYSPSNPSKKVRGWRAQRFARVCRYSRTASISIETKRK